MKKIIITIGLICTVAMMSHAQIKVFNSADNQALANSPAFVDASSNYLANGNASWGKGLVFPRVDLSTFTLPSVAGGYGAATNFPTYLDGMIVYNTATSGVAAVGSTQGTLSAGFWYYENKTTTATGGTWKPLGSSSGGNSVSVDSVVGNEVLDATAGGGLVRAGSGTAASPYTLGIATGGVTKAMLAAGAANDGDSIVGNEVTNATTGGGLVRAGSGTAASPYSLGIASGGVTGSMIAAGTIDQTKFTANAVIYSVSAAHSSIGVSPSANTALPSGCTTANTILNVQGTYGYCYFTGSTTFACTYISGSTSLTAHIWCFK